MTRRLGPMLLFVVLLTTSAYARVVTLGAVLTGSQEVPPAGSAFGNATVIIDTDLTRADVFVDVSGLGAPITGAHIHEGTAGVNGPVVVNFLTGTNAFTNNRFNAQFQLTPELMNRILANPSGFYVNVHTTQFPGGALRGQLTDVDAATHFAGELRGSNEVPPSGVSTIGAFHVTFDASNNVIFEVNYAGLDPAPTAAHIHRGANGVAGPVVIGLNTASTPFEGGRLKGVLPVSDAALVAEIKANPQNFYVNVHNSAFPGGAIRGQLFPAEEFDVPVAGRVTNSLNQTFVTDVRIFNPSYNESVIALVEYFATGNNNNTIANASKAVSIPPRGTAVLDDINGPAHLNLTGVGALRITSQEHLAVTSRIYADQRASGRGTFGQFVPSAENFNRLRRGVLPQLSNTAFDAANPRGYRTNIGFFNPNTIPVIMRLELREADGTLIGTNTMTIGSMSHQQNAITGYFQGVDLTNRADLTLSFDAAAPIVAYASVVDNVSADQIFVLAQDDPGVSTAP